jgi:hypothetical protein
MLIIAKASDSIALAHRSHQSTSVRRLDTDVKQQTLIITPHRLYADSYTILCVSAYHVT